MTTPVITKENATELVHMYFESQRLDENVTAYDKFCMLFNNRIKDKHFLGIAYKRYNDPYYVFCTIRLLEENSEGKTDDDQVDLLRQALKDYKKMLASLQDYRNIFAGQINMGSLIGIGAKL
jgi:hypothetical protein